MTVLKTSELVWIAISNSKNQITGSFCIFEAVDWLVKGFIPLQNISHNESKRVAESAFFSKGFVIEIDTYLADA